MIQKRLKWNFWRQESQYLKWQTHWVGLIVDHRFDVFKTILDYTKEKMGIPEDIAIKIVQNGVLRKKKRKINKEKASTTCRTIPQNLTYV